MTGFQSSVNIYAALGVPGDLAFDGPMRAAPWNLYSAAVPNIIGYAFTQTSGGNPDPTASAPLAGTAKVGGTGLFAGILVNSKEYSSVGTSSDPLAPTMTLPDYSVGELLTMGQIFVELDGPASPGDIVFYKTSDGSLSSSAPYFIGTATISATTMTVTAQLSGNTGRLGVGSQITGVNVLGGTVITAIASASGAAGTYTVNLSQTAASSTVQGSSVPASGYLAIPNCVVDRYDVAAVNGGGLAVIKLTN